MLVRFSLRPPDQCPRCGYREVLASRRAPALLLRLFRLRRYRCMACGAVILVPGRREAGQEDSGERDE